MKKFPRRMFGDQSGATAIEYGLILALIALALMSGLNALSGSTIDLWGNVSERVVNA